MRQLAHGFMHSKFRYVLSKTATLLSIVTMWSWFAIAVTDASTVFLQPNTTGTYSWDWIGHPTNQGSGFGTNNFVTVGGHQKQTFTRSYRGYMIFDTLAIDSSILSASLELHVTMRYTDIFPNPLSTLNVSLGLPTLFTPAEIAALHTSVFDPLNTQIYNDLGTNALGSFDIPFGDVFL